MPRRAGDDLVGRVVAVLLGVEPAPIAVAEVRDLGAEDAIDAGVAVGDVDAGDLVVAVGLAEAAVTLQKVGAYRDPRLYALNVFADRNELYWNVHGFDWDVGARSVSATVRSSAGNRSGSRFGPP